MSTPASLEAYHGRASISIFFGLLFSTRGRWDAEVKMADGTSFTVSSNSLAGLEKNLLNKLEGKSARCKRQETP